MDVSYKTALHITGSLDPHIPPPLAELDPMTLAPCDFVEHCRYAAQTMFWQSSLSMAEICERADRSASWVWNWLGAPVRRWGRSDMRHLARLAYAMKQKLRFNLTNRSNEDE